MDGFNHYNSQQYPAGSMDISSMCGSLPMDCIEQFSNEEGQLLLSVLASSSPQDQYQIAYPNSGTLWDIYEYNSAPLNQWTQPGIPQPSQNVFYVPGNETSDVMTQMTVQQCHSNATEHMNTFYNRDIYSPVNEFTNSLSIQNNHSDMSSGSEENFRCDNNIRMNEMEQMALEKTKQPESGPLKQPKISSNSNKEQDVGSHIKKVDSNLDGIDEHLEENKVKESYEAPKVEVVPIDMLSSAMPFSMGGDTMTWRALNPYYQSSVGTALNSGLEAQAKDYMSTAMISGSGKMPELENKLTLKGQSRPLNELQMVKTKMEFLKGVKHEKNVDDHKLGLNDPLSPPKQPLNAGQSHHFGDYSSNYSASTSSYMSSPLPTIGNHQTPNSSPSSPLYVNSLPGHVTLSLDEQTVNDDSDYSVDPSGNDFRSRRRASQNRASRNYRQRKKAYIREIEIKLEKLKLENNVLRSENKSIHRMMDQVQSGNNHAPLLRSYSGELHSEDVQIEQLVNEIEKLISSDSESDQLGVLLKVLRERMATRQRLIYQEAIQLMNPKMQERLVRLEGVATHHVEEQMAHLCDQVSHFVTKDQIAQLSELKMNHYNERKRIWEERNRLNAEIKMFYQEKMVLRHTDARNKMDQNAMLQLSVELKSLKKNLNEESALNEKTVMRLSSILTPLQEALITIRHYNHNKDKKDIIQMLTNVWTSLSKEK